MFCPILRIEGSYNITGISMIMSSWTEAGICQYKAHTHENLSTVYTLKMLVNLLVNSEYEFPILKCYQNGLSVN